MSFLFQYEIKRSDAYGIHIVNMDDPGKPYKIYRNLPTEAEALRVAREITAAHLEHGHRCHVHNSLGRDTCDDRHDYWPTSNGETFFDPT